MAKRAAIIPHRYRDWEGVARLYGWGRGMEASGYRPGPIARRVLRMPARLYDWNAGWLLGDRVLCLTHVGRRSGRRYQTMLEVIATGSATGEVIVVTGFGRAADWYRNLQTQPAVEVAIGRRRFAPVHRVLDEAEAAAVLADYESRHRWATPVLRRVLSWLVGWDYDGSDDARRRLMSEMPLVALRPSDRPPNNG
jgi:deazaflavin-dependent oxidoreductase (nitroreductase family)